MSNIDSQVEILEIYSKLNNLPIDFLQYITDCSECKNKDIVIEKYIINNSLSKIKKDLALYEFYYKFNDLDDAYFKRFSDDLNLKGNTKHDQIIYLLENYSSSELNKYHANISKEMESDIIKRDLLSRSEFDLDFLLYFNNIESTDDKEQDLLVYIMNTPLDKIKKDLGLYEFYYKFNDLDDAYFKRFSDDLNLKGNTKHNQIIYLLENYSLSELKKYYNNVSKEIKSDISKKNLLSKNEYDLDFLLNLNNIESTDDEEQDLLFYIMNTPLDKIKDDLESCKLFTQFLNIPDEYLLEFFETYERNGDKNKQILFLINNCSQNDLTKILKSINLKIEEDNSKKLFFKNFKLLNSFSEDQIIGILIESNLPYTDNKQENIESILKHLDITTVKEMEKQYREKIDFTNKLPNKDLKIILKENELSVSNKKQENINVILINLDLNSIIQIKEKIEEIKKQLNELDDVILNHVLFINDIRYSGKGDDLDYVILENVSLSRIEKNINELRPMLSLIDELDDITLQIILKQWTLPFSDMRQENVNMILKNLYYPDLIKSIKDIEGIKRQLNKFNESQLNKILSMNKLRYNDNDVALDDYIMKHLYFSKIKESINKINSMLKLINDLPNNQIKCILRKNELHIYNNRQDNIQCIIDNFDINDLKRAINKLPKRKSRPSEFMKKYVKKLSGKELVGFIEIYCLPSGGSKEENRKIILEYAEDEEFWQYIKSIFPELNRNAF